MYACVITARSSCCTWLEHIYMYIKPYAASCASPIDGHASSSLLLLFSQAHPARLSRLNTSSITRSLAIPIPIPTRHVTNCFPLWKDRRYFRGAVFGNLYSGEHDLNSSNTRHGQQQFFPWARSSACTLAFSQRSQPDDRVCATPIAALCSTHALGWRMK